MLASRTAGPVSIDLQIIIIDFNIDIFLNIRDHIAGRKDVCLFPAALNGEIRTRRCTPFSERR